MSLRAKSSLSVGRLKPVEQPRRHRCQCGQSVPVVQVTAYEFTWRCVCGQGRNVSWSHENDPPVFRAEAAEQVALFES